MRIKDLMSSEVVSIGPGATLKEAARTMIEAGVSGLPVVDDDGALVGIITESDFVLGEAGRRSEERAGLLRFFLNRQGIPSEERTVGDVMTRDVITVGPDRDHTEAARLMDREAVKRLPVVDNGRLVGIVSRADMLRAFNRSDEEILTEIRDHVMRDVLWIDPDRVTVGSSDGNVVLEGSLEYRSDAHLLVELSRRVDGVASVSDRLSWESDNRKGGMGAPPPARPRPNW
jgi:CBS domain-containing protein